MHAKPPVGLISALTISPWFSITYVCAPPTPPPLFRAASIPHCRSPCSLPEIVYSPLTFFASIPSHPHRHSSTETQSKRSVVNVLALRLSFLFPLPLCSFKFMLMSFPNRISESIDWGRLQWVLKVIGLKVSHTRQFYSWEFSLPPPLQWASASFIQTINTPAHGCSATLQRWEGRSTRTPEEINQCEMTYYHSSFYPLPLTPSFSLSRCSSLSITPGPV